MQRTVSAHLDAQVAAATDIVLSIAVARGPKIVDEDLKIAVGDTTIDPEEIVEPDGTRLHVVRDLPEGQLNVDYSATVDGQVDEPWSADLAPHVYSRPSRYCESDKLLQVAGALFADKQGFELVDAVRNWVNEKVLYLSGWSRVTDGSVDTFLQRQGVCRDFAHLVVTFLRSRNMPARLSSVYAPGLSPMDFHAVAEAYVDGEWYVIDATGLAPRESMLRIAIGRDAADTAFLTTTRGRLKMGRMKVTAVIDPELPTEDPTARVQLR